MAPHVNSGIIKCLRIRADKICDQKSRRDEYLHLEKTFRGVAYPAQIIYLPWEVVLGGQRDLHWDLHSMLTN